MNLPMHIPSFLIIFDHFWLFSAIFSHFWPLSAQLDPILALFGLFFTLRRLPSTDFVYIYIYKNLSMQVLYTNSWLVFSSSSWCMMPLDCLCHPNLDPFLLFFFQLSSLHSSPTHPPFPAHFPKYQSSQHGFRLDVCLFEFINATYCLKCALVIFAAQFQQAKG